MTACGVHARFPKADCHRPTVQGFAACADGLRALLPRFRCPPVVRVVYFVCRDVPYTCEGTPSAPGTYVEGTGTAQYLTQTTACTAADIMKKGDANYNFLVYTLLPDAIAHFQNSLSVIPVTDALYWPSTYNTPWSDAQCISPGHYIRPFVCCNATLPASGRYPGA